MNNQKSIPALLKELSIVLPGVELSGLNLDELMSFNVHALEEQYRGDTVMYSLFSILSKEAQHLVMIKKDDLEDMESTLEQEYRASLEGQGGRVTGDRIKSAYFKDKRFLEARTSLREVQHQALLLEGIVEALNKKHINLTMISSRQKAELQNRI